MRVFSLQFFEKVVLKVIVAKICNGKTKGLAIHCVNQYTFPIYIRKCTCFCSPTIGGDGSRQYGSDALVFVRVFCKTVLFYTRRKICNGKTKGLAIHCVNQHTFPIYIRKRTCFSPTIGGDGSRQYGSDALVLAAVF